MIRHCDSSYLILLRLQLAIGASGTGRGRDDDVLRDGEASAQRKVVLLLVSSASSITIARSASEVWVHCIDIFTTLPAEFDFTFELEDDGKGGYYSDWK